MFKLVIFLPFFLSFTLLQAQSMNFALAQVKSMFDNQSQPDVRSQLFLARKPGSASPLKCQKRGM